MLSDWVHPHIVVPFTLLHCQFAMEAGCHHLWPRRDYMMIAQPNVDRSFTLVLVMPFTLHESLTSEQNLLELFRRDMPDVLLLIGELVPFTLFYLA